MSQQKLVEVLVYLQYVQQYQHSINTYNTLVRIFLQMKFIIRKHNICIKLRHVFKELFSKSLVRNNYLTEQ